MIEWVASSCGGAGGENFAVKVFVALLKGRWSGGTFSGTKEYTDMSWTAARIKKDSPRITN